MEQTPLIHPSTTKLSFYYSETMKKTGVLVVSKPDRDEKSKGNMEVDLEEALDLAGTSKYQIFHCILMAATLTSAVIEMIGIAFILPAAACDLHLPESLKGIITSLPNFGIILTAPLWGHLADSRGRKPMLLLSCAGSGVFGVLAAFMPNLLAYAVCKFLGSLFLACPSSLGFAYVGELVPRRRRDLTVLLCNGILVLSCSFNPLLAWGILATDWNFPLSTITFRPWRLLTAVYAAPLVLVALWMTQAKESPKFLMAKGEPEKALEVLRHIYAKNTGLQKDEYCVSSLKASIEQSGREMVEDESEVALTLQPSSISALALLRPPHLKWLALTGFLMFGVFALINGLFLFATDTVNKVMRGSSEEQGTVCIVMNQVENKTSLGCVDSISQDTFLVMVVTTLASGVIVLVASMCPLSKKALLVAMFSTIGVACLLAGVLTNRLVAGAAMSALQLGSLGIGPLTAYAVHLFPTSLRGTAVGAVMMFGRIGSVVGANAAGFFLSIACTATFYGFTAFLILCAGLCFLLPKDQSSKNTTCASNHFKEHRRAQTITSRRITCASDRYTKSDNR